MEDRPEYFIGVSVVVFLVIVFDQIGEHVCLMSALDPLQGWSVGNLATPTKPDAWMSPQDRTDRDFKSSGPAISPGGRDCDTIGDHDKPRQQQPPGLLNVFILLASIYWACLETAARRRARV